MTSVLVDASPLIYFARLDHLGLLGRILGRMAVVPSVHDEAVVAGRQLGYPDAVAITSAIGDGAIEVVELASEELALAGELRRARRLGQGECETIACAARRGLRVLIEDKQARRLASEHGVRTLKSVDALYLGLLRREMELVEFKVIARELARITGMDAATLLEHETLAEEIVSSIG